MKSKNNKKKTTKETTTTSAKKKKINKIATIKLNSRNDFDLINKLCYPIKYLLRHLEIRSFVYIEFFLLFSTIEERSSNKKIVSIQQVLF